VSFLFLEPLPNLKKKKTMSRGVKITLIILGGLFVMGLGVYFLFQSWMSQPLYEPGKLATEEIVVPPQESNTDFWQVEEDIRLFHYSHGEGPAVLVVHGGPGIPFRGHPAGFDSLSRQYTFHYYDQRGCGQSSRPIDKFSDQNFYNNMLATDRQLGLGTQILDIERIRQIMQEPQLILVGHSYGAFLAALYAAEFPENVKGLVLITPADLLLMPPADGGLFDLVREKLPEQTQAEYDGYLARYLDFADIFAKTDDELVALNDEFGRFFEMAYQTMGFSLAENSSGESAKSGGWMVQAQYLSMGLKHDYREAMKQVKAPVLVLHGAKDLQSEAVSSLYVENLTHAKLHTLDGSGHFPFRETPEDFAKVVGDFLATLGS
jgi:proline iminopeptidase